MVWCSMKAFLLRMLQSCNPNTYASLADEKKRSTLRHFFTEFGILFLIMALLFIPAFYLNADVFGERLSAFSSADLDGNFTSVAPITLLERPRIVFDENATSAGGAWVTFGNDALFYKRFFWFGDTTIRYDDFRNLTTLDSNLVAVFAIFILPAIIFWSGVYILFKMLILIKLFAFLGWLLVGSFKQSVSYARAMQIAFYAAIPSLLIEMLLFPFWRSAWVSLLIYLVFFILGIALVSERKLKK